MRRFANEAEKVLWRAVTRDVLRLSAEREAPLSPSPVPPPPTDQGPAPSSKTVTTAPAPAVLPLRFDPAVEKRLASGRTPIEARVDLHGLTEPDAYRTLCEFVQACSARNVKLGLVITGRGRGGEGVLKRNVPRWLEAPALRPMVRAVRPAFDRDGGDGASYILFARPTAHRRFSPR